MTREPQSAHPSRGAHVGAAPTASATTVGGLRFREDDDPATHPISAYCREDIGRILLTLPETPLAKAHHAARLERARGFRERMEPRRVNTALPDWTPHTKRLFAAVWGRSEPAIFAENAMAIRVGFWRRWRWFYRSGAVWFQLDTDKRADPLTEARLATLWSQHLA